MKIKKQQFARLKDIAESVNYMLPSTGIKLDRLIADIESVQKPKTETVQEKPINFSPHYTFASGNIFDEQRKAVDDYIRKQGESMVAASIDDSTEFKGGLRDAVEAIAGQKIDIGSYIAYLKREKRAELVYNLHFSGFPTPELTSVSLLKADHSDYHQELLSDVVLYRRVDDTIKPEIATEPKIGDVGYFWTTGGDTRYGKIKEISSSEFKGETYTVYRIDQSDGCEFYVHFSKTPPELK